MATVELTGQTYLQREAAEGTVATMAITDLIRVTDDLMTIDDFIDQVISLGSIQAGNELTATDVDEAALTATAFDDSPTEAIVRAEFGANLAVALGTAFLSTAIGYVSARNVFPQRLHVTADQTEPAGIVAGDFWLRPRV